MNKAIRHDESVRYTRRGILRTEKLYGYGYQSPGGPIATRRFALDLDVASRSGLRVLDIGCGVGGAAMHLAEHHAATVTGVDIAHAPIEICKERVRENGQKGLTFFQGDASQADLFPPRSFDLVWTRDTILYVNDKLSFWRNAFGWLKPGGQLFVTDFGRGDRTPSAEFLEYVADSCFCLQDFNSYRHAIEEAGFSDVESEDITCYFIDLNRQELAHLLQHRDDFLSDFDESEIVYLVDRWEKKIRFAEAGNLIWLRFKARRPFP